MQNATNHIKRELQLTADGSHTLFIPEMDEHYHSVNGAVQESRHVFIEAGLHHLERKEIVVLEIERCSVNSLFVMPFPSGENNVA